MARTRLLYIITKLELGGAQKQLLSLINSLDQDKFEIFLFTARSGLLLEDAFKIKGLKVFKSSFLERPINPLKDLLACLEIYQFIKKNKIQLVHTHSSKAGHLGRFAAKLAGIKIIIHTVHGWSFNDYQSGLKRKIYIWLEKFAAGFSNQIIVVSQSDREKGLKNGIGQADRYSLVRYGIDQESFKLKNTKVRQELGINSGDLVVGMVSCFKPQKAPQDFIRLASLINHDLPDTKFILVGDGELRSEIEKLIRKLNLENRVLLLGWRRDIPAILSALDLFVLTSLWEGLPIVVLEAMSATCAVVVSDTGGISEVISNGKNGFIVRPQNLREFAQKSLLLLKNSELRISMGQKAEKSLNSDFCSKNIAAGTQDIYNNLIQAFMS